MRGADEGDQWRHPHWAKARTLQENLIVSVAASLREESLLSFLAEFRNRLSRIQPRFGPKARSLLRKVCQPLTALICAIDGLPGTIDPTTAIDCLPPILNASRIFHEGIVGTAEIFSLWLLIIAFGHGVDRPQPQKVREFLGIFIIRLVAVADPLVVTWFASRHGRDQRLNQLMQPGRWCAFFKDHFDFAAHSAKEIADGFGFRLDLGSALELTKRIQNHNHANCFVDIHAHILDVVHWTLLFELIRG